MRLIKSQIKLIVTVFSFLILFASFSNAQIRFQKVYGGTALDWSNCVIQTTDSNFLMMCSSVNFGSGLEDVYLIKTNQSGDTLWTRTYGGSTNDEEGYIVQQTLDGGFILSGTTESFGAGGSDIFLIKTDALGGVTWSTTYGGANVDFCTGAQECFDGGYIISGYTTSFGAGGGTTDLFLIKTDIWGDTSWTKTFGSSGIEYGYNAKQTADSGFVIVGSTNVNGPTDVYLIKTDVNGNIVWTRTYGGASDDVGFAILTLQDGYCIAGSTMSFGAGGMDAYLIKTDLNGDTLWSKTYGTSDSDACLSIKQTADAGFIMTGFANKHNGTFDDVLIIKTDSAGNMEWSKVVGGTSSARDVGRCAIPTYDGGYLISGFTQSFGGGTEIILIKTDLIGISGCNTFNATINTTSPATSVGTFAPQESHGGTITFPVFLTGTGTCNMTILCMPAGIQNPDGNNNSLTFYPNPFSASVQVKLNEVLHNRELIFVLVDMMGREMSRTIINGNNITDGNSFTFERGNLLPGMYMFHLIDASNVIGSGKLVAE